jgi:hypothetical protein
MSDSRKKTEQGPQEAKAQNMVQEHYFELCALATTGTLTDSEWSQLKSHLLECGDCADLLQKYREIARTGMSLLLSEESVGDHDEQESWTPELAKKELFARIARGEQVGWSHDPSLAAQHSERRSLWAYFRILRWPVTFRYAVSFAVAVIVLGLVYHFGMNNGQKLARAGAQSPLSEARSVEKQIEGLKREKTSLDEQLNARDSRIESLSKQMQTATADLAKLKSVQQQTEQNLQQQTAALSEAHVQNNSVVTERDAIARRLQDAESSLASMRMTLDGLRQERTADLLHTTSLETRIAELSARLQKQDDLSAVDAQLLTSDRDIRELMGARDLYIADVFDVDSNGHTERPFGRVFYTRNRSLIFYAFDLDKQRGVRKNASEFQAWGRRGLRDDHPVNMGIFYLDSETNRRWVLKFDNPDTLERIETVFVTVEPKGGSQEPRGKAFLVASLRSQPNHP